MAKPRMYGSTSTFTPNCKRKDKISQRTARRWEGNPFTECRKKREERKYEMQGMSTVSI